MKTIEFLTIEKDGDVLVADENYLELAAKAMKVDKLSDEELSALGKVEKHKVSLKPAKFGLKNAIKAAAQVEDEMLGRRIDEDLLPSARASVVVDTWCFGEVSKAAFDDLDLSVAEYIDAAIVSHLYPDLGRDKDFFLALSAKSKLSEGKQAEKA